MGPYSFEILVDEGANVLRLTQRGFATAADVGRLSAAYRTALERLRPGFAIVNDQRDLEGIADDAQPLVLDLVRYTNDKAVGLLIRVVPAALQASVRMGKLLVQGNFHYKSVSVNSLAEAQRVLQESRPA